MILTLLIACSSDERLIHAIESVDLNQARILVGLNKPSETVRQIVRHHSVPYIEISTSNLARIHNALIEASTTDAVMFLDSDCVLVPGALSRICAALDSAEVVKPRLEYDRGGWWSRLIADVRMHTTTDMQLLLLPLAFKKHIREKIGGRFFAEALDWGEDTEFAQRIRRSPLTVLPVNDAVVKHRALNLFDDLRSAFRLGRGRFLRARAKFEHYRSPVHDLLFRNELRLARPLYERFGTAAALYHLLGWRLAYKAGYYKAALTEGQFSGTSKS